MQEIKIIKIQKKHIRSKLYNLAVENDETYVANGIVVHNCRSLLVPVTNIGDDQNVEIDKTYPKLQSISPGSDWWKTK
jgi:hypothetical protein